MLKQSSLNYLSFVNRVYELLIVANNVMRGESEADRAAISTLTAAFAKLHHSAAERYYYHSGITCCLCENYAGFCHYFR